MTDLVLSSNGGTVRLYEKMQAAIAACHTLDDCKAIADQAAAIGAYYDQIKDDASMRQYIEIKLRAWRRIGEILREVDVSDCESLAARNRKIRAAFKGDTAVDEMTDAFIQQAVKIADLPSDFFERNVDKGLSNHALLYAYGQMKREEWEASPEGQAEIKQRAERYDEQMRREHAQAIERNRETTEEERALQALKKARKEAIAEVGVTLERRDRETMRETVFLLREPVHEALRRAAFDHRMTMQAILRAGLAMWFIANGYDVPMSKRDLRSKPVTKKTAKAGGHPEIDSGSPTP